jgi:dihydrofolate reductase
MRISLVAAASDNNVIGKNGALPWKMPADMKFFKNLTTGHTVIMGRKTYESMGKPLAGRKNIVITRNKEFKAEGCIVLNSLDQAFEVLGSEAELFVIGGADIYNTVLFRADKIYLTRVHGTFDGDAYFPQITDSEWVEIKSSTFPADEKNPYPYTFIELARKKVKVS